MKFNFLYKQLKKPIQLTRKYDVSMSKDYNISADYISPANKKVKIPLRNITNKSKQCKKKMLYIVQLEFIKNKYTST